MNDALWVGSPTLRAVGLLIGAGLTTVPAEPARLPDRLDWIGVVTLALAHNAAGLLHRAVVAGAAPGIPPALASALARHAATIAVRNTQALAEMSRLRTALTTAGIDSMPLKGAWLGQRNYNDLAARPSRDIDLLLPPGTIDTTLATLDACGYPTDSGLTRQQVHAKVRYAGQLVFHRSAGRFVVEPHWALAPHTLSVDIDHRGLWARARPTLAGGLMLPTLEPEDEFIMLCMHGFKEEWARLKWLSDLAAFTLSHPGLNTATITARAKDQGVWWMVLVGLELLHQVFSITTPLTAHVMSVEKAGHVADAVLALMADSAITPGRIAPESNAYKVSAIRMAMRERRRDRARYRLRTFLTPREIHFRNIPLHGALYPLHYLTKPLHDYAALPTWVALKRCLLRV